ncbi:NDxxF motif lipoprotein [Gracilibacillus sp. HCP3S3_G5_1]|uniref:NDxxF motif lipoprotein n=1 Tax=unclassified Gracilibacillus TaxID=2625209 RepID=UPI003F8BADE1
MRKICYAMLIMLILSACSQAEMNDANDYLEDEAPQVEDIEIPNTIFQSDKHNSSIDEEEMKSSIKKYLDTYEDLFIAFYQLEEILYVNERLNEKELETLDEINQLTKENDENFAQYIANNTLPEGYQEEVERMSNYITNINQFIKQLDEKIDSLVDNISDGDFSLENFDLLPENMDKVNGREQKKIEDFLDEKNINTKAFGRSE